MEYTARMNRIETLREEALHPSISNDEFCYRFFRQYDRLQDKPEYERYAEAFAAAFSELTPFLSDGELIVGKTGNGLSDAEQKEWEETYSAMARTCQIEAGGGQDSHMAIDYELLLRCGLRGILSQIDGYLETCDAGQVPFYKACKTCLLAVIRHAENYADAAVRMAEKETDAGRRAELQKLAQICRKVPAQPAESFYEAVQSVHFITYCLSINPLRRGFQQFQLGHPDRYLLPYYRSDLEKGVLTREEAALLLDCLGIPINLRVPSGLSCGYMVGGRDENGQIVENDLTEMCMQVVDDIRLVYPAVGFCYTEGMSDRCLETACRILLRGRTHPAIFNDDIITKGLRCYGVPEREAHAYIHSTCVEITPVASSNVWVASPYTNMVQLLLDTMEGEYASFDEHLQALLARLDAAIQRNFEAETATRRHRAAHSMNPLLSCFVNDCLARGLDIERGGARYNWIMPSFVGMANLVDSLYAVKTIVYDRGEMTLGALKQILDSNFEGQEPLRRRLLETLPKYGNDMDEIDAYFTLFINHIVRECKKYKGIHTSGNLIPSVFCWVMHESFGTKTGATPDGRKAGFPLGDGSGPCQGREQNGPTASILSSTKWPHHELIGGVAVNMKFSKSTLGPDSEKTMMQLIKTYFQRGGFEMQINVTDRKILEAAREHPENYRDLLVRIGGYSDYFVRLSPGMQEEILLRTEHTL